MATKENMTIHKALSELKIIDDRIESKIAETRFAVPAKTTQKKIGGIDTAEYLAGIKADFDSISDLIKRRYAIKRAVVKSNAVTTVTINDVEYTVAEAIEMNNHGLNLKGFLVNKISRDFAESQNTCEMANKQAEETARATAESVFKDSDKQIKDESVTKLIEKMIEENTYEIKTPLDCKSIIDEMDAEISNFKTEVDSALSVSNATTIIEIEY